MSTVRPNAEPILTDHEYAEEARQLARRLVTPLLVFSLILTTILLLPDVTHLTPEDILDSGSLTFMISYTTLGIYRLLGPWLSPPLRRRGWSFFWTWGSVSILSNFLANIVLLPIIIVMTEPEDVPLFIVIWMIIAVGIAIMATLTLWAADYVRRELAKGRMALRRNAMIEQELKLAHSIQAAMLPREAPAVPGLQIAGICTPAREVGGDLLSYQLLPGGEFSVSVGDVTGKSVSAAMLMGVTLGALQAEVFDHIEPAMVLAELNRWLRTQTGNTRYVALTQALFDLANQCLILGNAGHVAPLLRRNGVASYLELPPGLPLGIGPHVPLQQVEVPLQKGDLLVFYTDGVIEAHNAQQELFGFDQLAATIDALPSDTTASAAMERLLQAVQVFTAGAEQHDDLTLVVVRVE